MAEDAIRFDDGAQYEEMMGRWSAQVGDIFLDWLQIGPAARWLDVGCGNGAFTARVFERNAPAAVTAFDPSPEQLAYARTRLPAGTPVTWVEADAQALPVEDAAHDVAIMALVLFFVPDPRRGIAEMVRAVRAGGTVAAYHWDMLGHGFPFAALGQACKAADATPRMPPSVDASTLEASKALWLDAGLTQVELRTITVESEFRDFDSYWNTARGSNAMRPMFNNLDADQLAAVKSDARARLGAGDGALRVTARANAVKGVKPRG